MNNTINSILNRHSSREFTEQEIRKEDLNLLMKCALQAPSARGIETTNIYCVSNKEQVQMLESLGAKEGKSDPFYHAPVIVIFTGNGGTDHDIRNASAAIENLLIAAESLGIGSCWIHQAVRLFNIESNKEVFFNLGIKENEQVMGAVILGYSPKMNPKTKDESHIHMI